MAISSTQDDLGSLKEEVKLPSIFKTQAFSYVQLLDIIQHKPGRHTRI